MKKDDTINTENDDILQLVSREDIEKQFGESAASYISKDQVVSWAKFILTDDKPNANNERVPKEEFDNLIKTGFYKPIKMAMGEIKEGHDDAKPLGVITHLAREGNKIVALAALWETERIDDVSTIKERINSGKPVNVSWEILYGDFKINGGVKDLYDTVLKAVTIVGMPAYKGRTPVLAVAAIKKWSPAYIEKLPDEHFLHVDSSNRLFAYRDDTGKIDTSRFPDLLEEISQASLSENIKKSLRHQIKKMTSVINADAGIRELLEDASTNTMEEELDTKELETKVADLEKKLSEASNTIATKESELAKAQEDAKLALEKAETLEEELQPLREFKQQADEAVQRAEKLSAIKGKFESLELEKDEKYFEENAEKLLSLDENGLDFLLQEMVAFKGQDDGQSNSSKRSSGVPNVPGKSGSISISDLAKALRERKNK